MKKWSSKVIYLSTLPLGVASICLVVSCNHKKLPDAFEFNSIQDVDSYLSNYVQKIDAANFAGVDNDNQSMLNWLTTHITPINVINGYLDSLVRSIYSGTGWNNGLQVEMTSSVILNKKDTSIKFSFVEHDDQYDIHINEYLRVYKDQDNFFSQLKESVIANTDITEIHYTVLVQFTEAGFGVVDYFDKSSKYITFDSSRGEGFYCLSDNDAVDLILPSYP